MGTSSDRNGVVRDPIPTSRTACKPPKKRLSSDPVAIPALLRSLGFSSSTGQAKARGALETARLTHAGKQNIAQGKVSAVRALLDSLYVRTCGSEECDGVAARDSRETIHVASRDCRVCGGRRALRAIHQMADQIRANGLRKILVVGGSPASHVELRLAFKRSGIELVIVDGECVGRAGAGRVVAQNADVIVIWSSTILSHAVSAQCGLVAHRAKTVTVAKRGIEALCDAVVIHLEKTREVQE